ncbi:MAG: hypothetical protein WCO84_01305 [bacterium]
MKIYTGGAMSFHFFNGEIELAKKWRNSVKYFFDVRGGKVDIYNPAKCFLELNGEYNVSNMAQLNYQHLKNSDVFLLDLNKLEESIGTIWEISLCWQLHIPIVAFGKCEKWQYSPHYKEMVKHEHKDLDDALNYIWLNFF